MKILLVGVNSKYIHMNPAVYSLLAYAEEKLPTEREAAAENNVLEVAEYTINQPMEELLIDIYRKAPDVIGFSCYIWNWRMIRELMVELKKVLPHTDIFLGGPEVSYEAEALMKQYGSNQNGETGVIKGIILGEGEETFTEIVEHYFYQKSSLTDIAGLLLETGFTGERAPLNFNELPFLYGNLEKGTCNLKAFQNKILYYESSRGCPFRCSYCLSSIDKRVRLRSLEKVLPEIQFFLDEKVPQVKFIDRTFNCNKEHALSIWNYLMEHDNGITNFHFEIASELVDEEELEVFRRMRPGLIQLEIGVQTTNQETLKEINRKADLEHLSYVVSEIQKNRNIHVHLDLIAGLPKEDYVRFRQSFNEIYRLHPEQLQLGFLKVLKGTLISSKQKDYGLVYESEPPYEVLFTKWITYEQIRKLKQIEEMVETYYNTNQFTHTIRALAEKMEETFPESSSFGLFERLAHHYEVHGYFLNTPARAYRYEVLLEFACEQFPMQRELWTELLTYDYYLRENAKSRPAFCKPLTEYYTAVWEFYQKEELEHRYLPDYASYHAKQVMKMTHMEVFQYPVWEEGVSFKRNTPTFVLFDYQKRSPLTGDADARPLLPEELSGPDTGTD